MALDVTIDGGRDVVIARLVGDLDRGADEALATLEPVAGRGLVLDMTGVGFIASSGLALLVRLLRAAAAGGGRVAVFGLHAHYRDVFAITRLDTIAAVRDDSEAAVAAVREWSA